MTCKPVIPPSCKPTPFVGYASAARWVRLTYSASVSLKMQLIDDMARLLARTYRPTDHFPLTAAQCHALIEALDNQIPDVAPTTCVDLDFRLLETQIYHLNQWRYWVETQLAEQLTKVNIKTIGGHIAHERIKLMYNNLTDLKRRLRAPVWRDPAS